MAFHRYRIKPHSPFGTPMQSDTLYGHLLCAVRLLDGEQRLVETIELYENNAPPFLVSSAFPGGMLPLPVLPPIPRDEFQVFARDHWQCESPLLKALEEYKKFKKKKHVSLDIFRSMQTKLTRKRLFSAYLAKPSDFDPVESCNEYEPHNSIDRNSGTVLSEGGLYFTEATFYGRDAHLDLYLQTDDIQAFERYFSYLADTGFGRDRTTGKGYFSFERDNSFDAAIFSGETDIQMILSICSGMNMSGFKGTYSTITKYGKVWNGFGENNPFKKPFLAFSEGSLFSRMPNSGYVLHNIHSDPNIVQITMPLKIPVGLEG